MYSVLLPTTSAFWMMSFRNDIEGNDSGKTICKAPYVGGCITGSPFLWNVQGYQGITE